MSYTDINDHGVIFLNQDNIEAILAAPFPVHVDQETIKSLNRQIFSGIEVKGYYPGTFRTPSDYGALNLSSRVLISQGNRQIFSMRSFMDEKALKRLDAALDKINPGKLNALNTREFEKHIGSIYAVLDYTHPFADGNSRTFRTFTQAVAQAAGFNLDWNKIASDQFLRDELYCARGIEVNRLALQDPDQQKYRENISNMLEDLQDKRDLCTLFHTEKIITPTRSIAFRHEVQQCLNIAGNDPQAFKSHFTQSCDRLAKSHPEISTSIAQLHRAVNDAIKDQSDLRGYAKTVHIILPAFHTLLAQGEQKITPGQIRIAMLDQIDARKQKEAGKTKVNPENIKPSLTLYLIAGPNGSGKSTSYEFLKNTGTISPNTPFINPDVYAKELTNQYGYKNVNELPRTLKSKVDIEAGKKALIARDECFKNKQTFIIETTASSRGTIKLMQEAKSQGYQVNVQFVTLKSAELNQTRVEERAKFGGHFVEPEIVERRFNKAMALMPEILANADTARLIDNSVKPEAVLIKSSGKIQTFPNENWNKVRLNSLINEMKKFTPDLSNQKARGIER